MPRTRRMTVILTGSVVLMSMVADLGTGAAPESIVTQGLLAGLSGDPGPHVAKIKALGDNAWLELGAPAADPKWGRARGRSWTSEMPLAPELRGAFLFGEGRHGYAKPDGYYMDDLWFYDIHGHRWICCYPGANTKNLDLTINADGFEATKDGQLIPVASQVHGYEMNTYDTDRRRFLSMPNSHPYWKTALPQREHWLKPAPANASPWMFDTTTGQWQRRRTQNDGPTSSYGDTLIYLPGRKQVFFLHRNQDVWFFDPQGNSWKTVEPKGPKPPFGIDATSCYDPKRDRVYIGGGSYPVAAQGTNALWIYDLKTDTWIDPQPQGAPCRGSTSYPTKNAVMVYDPAHDVVLLVFHSIHDDRPERLGVYVYDPTANAWGDQPLAVPDDLGRDRKTKNGFFDPQLNAVFIHTAGDSLDDGSIWVYRYREQRAEIRGQRAEIGDGLPKNTKSEARNTKQIRSTKFEKRQNPLPQLPFGISDLKFVSNFGFRHSNFGAGPADDVGPTATPDTMLVSDFETDDWWRDWGARSQPANTGLVEGAAAFSGKGRSLKVEIPQGSTTGANFLFRFRERTGAEPDEMYFRYDLRLDPDWKNAIDGGKLPGFTGTYNRAGWGGRKVNGSDGWSARGSFRRPRSETTTVGFYCYHADMRTNYGDIWDFQPPLKYDTWYGVEMYCKLNTPGKENERGQSDGILRGWIDGQLAFEKSDIRFRDADTLKIEAIWVNVYHGGTRPTPQSLHLYLDNFVIARKAIGRNPRTVRE